MKTAKLVEAALVSSCVFETFSFDIRSSKTLMEVAFSFEAMMLWYGTV